MGKVNSLLKRVAMTGALMTFAPALPVFAATVPTAAVASSASSSPPSSDAGADHALERLSDMKIRHAVLEESLKNIQVEAHIKAEEKKMRGNQGASSAGIPVVSVLTCSDRSGHDSGCVATLLLPNGSRIPAYPGTSVGNGLKIVDITGQGVLAAGNSSRFYLPFSGGSVHSAQGGAVGETMPAPQGVSALPPPVFSNSHSGMTQPAAMPMPPTGMPSAGMQ